MSAFIHHGFRGGFLFGWLPIKALQLIMSQFMIINVQIFSYVAMFFFGIKLIIGASPDLIEALCRMCNIYSDMKFQTHLGAINNYMSSGWRLLLFPEWALHTIEDKKIWHYYKPYGLINNAGFWISCLIDILIIYIVWKW